MNPKEGAMNIKEHVDQLFKNLTSRTNPVTGDQFFPGEERAQKRKARRALLAREYLREYGPKDLPPLPLLWNDSSMKNGGVEHMFALYAQSLRAFDFDIQRHPAFEQYAAHIVARGEHHFFVGEGFQNRRPGRRLPTAEELERRFPPRVLPGMPMEHSRYYWKPPEADGGQPLKSAA
jgi:hypothetical protein